jgi:CDP-diacylglycerol---glycerol-3-phosphate 3-phosphatidyltransferase
VPSNADRNPASSPGPRTDRPTWLPNALVWARLGLAAVFIALLSGKPLDSPASLVAAAAIFAVAALTDMLDGILARAWRCVSRFGRVMDAFADKVLVLGAFICLAGPAFHAAAGPESPPLQASGVLPWMAVTILARELLITSLRGLVEGEGGDFSAIWAGKWKMIAQSLAVPVILLALALLDWAPGTPGRLAIDALVWATLLITVASAVPYIRRAAAFRQRPTPEPPTP